MERKLVKQGRNALTVTLPAAWLKQRGLSVGDVVQIEKQNNNLIISSSLAPPKSEVELNLRDVDKSTFFNVIMGKYIEGYDKIIVLHSSSASSQEIAQALTGFVIEELTPTKLVLKNLIAVPDDSFDVLLRRAAHMLAEQANLLEGVTTGDVTYTDIKSAERLLDKTLLYCLRYLNKYESRSDSFKYFLLCSTLESIGDHVSLISQKIGNDVALAKSLSLLMNKYTHLLFKQDVKKMNVELKNFKNNLSKNNTAHGIARALAESMKNYIGYLVKYKES